MSDVIGPPLELGESARGGAWVSDESRVLVSPAFEEVQAVFPGKADPAGELDEIMQEVGG
ncbi:MAG: hypothetical protein ACI9C1_003776, partial [Candidatus Aldehydirespiratoraceae bacterium]